MTFAVKVLQQLYQTSDYVSMYIFNFSKNFKLDLEFDYFCRTTNKPPQHYILRFAAQ